MLLGHLLDRFGRCDRMAIGSLGFNAKNLRQLLGWLDCGTVGELTLLLSLFFRSHNGALWERTITEFAQRKQRCACGPSHAKVYTLAFCFGEKYTIETSGNLCGNGSARGGLSIIRDDDLTNWHRAWIQKMVAKHDGNRRRRPVKKSLSKEPMNCLPSRSTGGEGLGHRFLCA